MSDKIRSISLARSEARDGLQKLLTDIAAASYDGDVRAVFVGYVKDDGTTEARMCTGLNRIDLLRLNHVADQIKQAVLDELAKG